MCLDSFEKSVMKTAEKHNMISPGDRIVAGLSGGADSSVMLCVLKALAPVLNFEVCAAHLNHGIRGGGGGKRQVVFGTACKIAEYPLFYGNGFRTRNTHEKNTFPRKQRAESCVMNTFGVFAPSIG